MTVSRGQRYTRDQPCWICGGCESDPRGQSRRCIGFLSADGRYARCSREEQAGALQPDSTGCYLHRLDGSCRCGTNHGSSGSPGIERRTARTHRSRRRYVYRSEDASPIFSVVRTDWLGDKGWEKKFHQESIDAAGNWQLGLHGASLMPYRLPEIYAVASDAPIFVAEGEKCVDRLHDAGSLATCNPMGAGKWNEIYNQHLRGRHVVVLPDNDEPGRRHGQQVAASLNGVAASVRVVDLPGLPPKGDIVDWFAAGHAVAELEELAAKTPVWSSSGPTRPDPQRQAPDVQDEPQETPKPSPVQAVLVQSGMTTLTKTSSREEVDAAVTSLALAAKRLTGLDAQLVRSHAVRALKTAGVPEPARVIAAAVARDVEASNTDKSPAAMVDVEPWSFPVQGAKLLTELVAVLRRYVVLPLHAAPAAALWIVHTHAIVAAQITPRLAIVSPAMRCGKSTLLKVLLALVRRPLLLSNITAAVMFRVIEQRQPTLLVDEADTFLSDKEDLRGIIDAGHDRATATVMRVEGEKRELVEFRCFGSVAIAKINDLQSTIMDRSIVINMRRRAPGEVVQPFPRRERDALVPLASRCARWAADNLAQLQDAVPVPPEGLNDRAADNWEPLLAIADAAGGEWPALARLAAQSLSGEKTVDLDRQALGVQLLGDLRDLWADPRWQGRVASANICSALASVDGRPWAEVNGGRPITPTRLAKLLRPFGLRSRDQRGNSDLPGSPVRKGYDRAEFEDAFARYLPPIESAGVTSDATAATGSDSHENVQHGEPLQPSFVAGGDRTEKPFLDRHVALVAPANGHAASPALYDAEVEEGEIGGEIP